LPYYKAQKDLEQFAKIVGWLDQLTLQRSRAGFLAALRRRKQLSGNGVPARLDLG
jgi:hypothetical protein